jgi:hypothetical protein
MGANAQTTVPTFTASQVLTAAQMNASARTGVPVFATTTDRDAAFGGTGEKTLAEGQLCFIEASPKRIQIYDGTSWQDINANYTDFTPTWSQLNVGNGTQVARYLRTSNMIHFYGKITLGSTSSITGNVTFPAPVSSTRFQSATIIGFAVLLDASAGATTGLVFYDGDTIVIQALNTAGTYGGNTALSSVVPFTWTTSDYIAFWGLYAL